MVLPAKDGMHRSTLMAARASVDSLAERVAENSQSASLPPLFQLQQINAALLRKWPNSAMHV